MPAKRPLRWETITLPDGQTEARLGHDDIAIKCKVCGQRDLHWVDVQLVGGYTGPGWSAADARTSGFKYVPIGSNDLSGNVHSLRPETCRKATGSVAPAPAAAPQIGAAYDDSNLRKAIEFDAQRIESLNKAVVGVQQDVRDMGNAVATRLTEVGTDIVDIRNEVAAIAASKATVVEIKLPSGKVKDMGRQHHQFANAVTMLNVIGSTGALYMVGEPGSRKTSTVHLLAEALDTEHEIQSVGLETTMAQLVGFHNVNGTYMDTALYRRFTEGGVFAVDEADTMRPGTATVLNAAIANDEYGFPCGKKAKHPDFRMVFLGNTFGRGPDAQFNGRTQLDAATLDRLCYLPWNIDWSLLGESLGLDIDGDVPEYPAPGAPRKTAEYADWGTYCKRIRNVAQSMDMRVIVSSRAVINGAKLLAAGLDRKLVEYSTIWGHMSSIDASTIRANL